MRLRHHAAASAILHRDMENAIVETLGEKWALRKLARPLRIVVFPLRKDPANRTARRNRPFHFEGKTVPVGVAHRMAVDLLVSEPKLIALRNGLAVTCLCFHALIIRLVCGRWREE